MCRYVATVTFAVPNHRNGRRGPGAHPRTSPAATYHGRHLWTYSPMHMQATSNGAGTFHVNVSIDLQTCGPPDNHPAQPNPASPRGSPPHVSPPAPAQHSVPVNVSIATIAVDADGLELPDTFYPYYGTTLRERYLPDAVRTFQAEFWPYAVVELGPAAAPAVVPGSFTARNITSAGFEVTMALTQPAVAGVRFAVVEGDIAAAVRLEAGAGVPVGSRLEDAVETKALQKAIDASGGLEALALQAAASGAAGDAATAGLGVVVARGSLASRPASTGDAGEPGGAVLDRPGHGAASVLTLQGWHRGDVANAPSVCVL